MRRDKATNQVIRFDGKSVFLEVMKDGFGIEQVQINFITYDVNRPEKDRVVNKVPMYLDFAEFSLLANDMKSGRLAALAEQAKKKAKEENKPYAKEIYLHQGGIPAERLKEQRPDGKALARELRITPGVKSDWVISADIGAGEESETGLIQLRGKPEITIRVPLSNVDFKKFFLYTERHIDAFLAAQYVKDMLTRGDFLVNLIKKAFGFLMPKGAKEAEEIGSKSA